MRPAALPGIGAGRGLIVLDLRPIVLVIGILLIILALFMVPPMVADIAAGHPDWQVFLAAGAVTLFAGVRKQAPKIKDAHFCKSGGVLAELGPPLPTRKPAPDLITSSLSEPSPPPVPPTKPGLAEAVTADPEAVFLAAKEKAKREGVFSLTSEDIRGLSLEQIKALRGY